MATNISTRLKSKGKYSVSGALWIAYEGERCFGPGPMQLLQEIDKTGSINNAAKEMGMSYKKAWTIISDLNKHFNEPLVVTKSGGEGGGGSVITDTAKSIMKYHEDLRKRFAKFLETETGKLNK